MLVLVSCSAVWVPERAFPCAVNHTASCMQCTVSGYCRGACGRHTVCTRRPPAGPTAGSPDHTVEKRDFATYCIQYLLCREGLRVRIAVLGAGAIGAYWGAALDRGGAEVD